MSESAKVDVRVIPSDPEEPSPFPYVFDLKGVVVVEYTGNEGVSSFLAPLPPDYHGHPWIGYRTDRETLVQLAKEILRVLDEQ